MWRISWLTEELRTVCAVRYLTAATLTFMKMPRSDTVTYQLCIARLRPQGPLHHQRQSHKPYLPPTSVTWLQNAGTSISLTAETHWFKRTTSRTFPTYNISLGSLTLRAPKAGDFVELKPVYVWISAAWVSRGTGSTDTQFTPVRVNWCGTTLSVYSQRTDISRPIRMNQP